VAVLGCFGYTQLPAPPPMKIVVILFLIFIVGSLGSALYFLIKDRGQSDRMVKALTVRVVLSVVLFALLMLGFYLGFITGKIQ
jgi:hypothetical protein